MRCVKLQVQQQPDANYLFFCACVGVFTQTAFTLASPHLHAILAARLLEALFLRRCEVVSAGGARDPAWRRIFNRPTPGDESAGFRQLIGVFGGELAAVPKPASSVVGRPGGGGARSLPDVSERGAATAGWARRSPSDHG